MNNKIVRFLQDNIIGKILYNDNIKYSLENGKFEGIYSDEMIFSDISTTENGIQFHMTTVSKEKVYALDSNGNHQDIIKNYTGTSVFRYELALRKSTSQITGYVRCVSTTVKNQTMEAVVYGVYNVELNENELKWKEQQLLYRDSPSGDTSYRPVAFDSSIRL